MLLKAPAKINLTLRILSKRPDGYHLISSKMQAIRLYDEVDCRVVYTHGEEAVLSQNNPAINVITDNPGIPAGPENLAHKAAVAALKKLACGGAGLSGINITIKKNIPVAAGLAGGSADAAAVLLAIAKELSPEKDISEIAAVGAKIGADVSFCVYACAEANPGLGYAGMKAALAKGIGDVLTNDFEPEKAWIVLVKPEAEISTREIYCAFDEDNSAASGHSTENDLEEVCISVCPLVGETIFALRRIITEENAGPAKVQLSGSGPTVFAYFGEKTFGEDAEKKAMSVYERAKTVCNDSLVLFTDTF